MGSLFELKEKYGIKGSAGSAAQSSTLGGTGGLAALKERTVGRLNEMTDSFKRYSLGANTVTRYLQSDSWDDNARHQWYSDLVSSRRAEIGEAMEAAEGNDFITGKLREYADYYDSLAKGLSEREAFYSQFQSKADYDSYAAALTGARDAVAAGGRYDDWYQTATANAKAASDEVDRLEGELSVLGASASMGLWDEQGNYLGENHSYDDEYQKKKEELDKARLAAEDANRQAQYAGAWRWEDLPGKDDYYKNAAAGLKQFEADSAAEKTRQDAESAQKAEAYYAMGAAGSGAGAYEDDLMTQLRNDTRWREPRENWTEQERNTFGYLYAEDPEKAYEYGQYINDRNAALSRYEKERSLGEWADKNFFTRAASFGAGVLSMPAGLADYLDAATEYAARGTVTQKDYISLADAGDLMVGAVSEGLNERHGTWDSKLLGEVGLGDVYQLGVSVAQSMAWGHVLGAAGTSAAFFGSAARSGYEEAKARGADDGKALWYGFAAGLAETGCEYFSLDKLLSIKTPTSFTGVMLSVLKQSGIEGSEEALTTICNLLSDEIINGDKSQLSTRIATGMAKGLSYEEAAKAAEREWLQGLAKDAIGGVLSGGVSGMIESGVQSVGSYRGNGAQLIDQGLAAGGEAEAMAKDLQERWTRFTQENETSGTAQAQEGAANGAAEARKAEPKTGAETAQDEDGRGNAKPGTRREAVADSFEKSGSENSAEAEGQAAEQEESQAQERESEEKPADKKEKSLRISKLEAQRLIEAIENEDRGKIRQAVEAQLERMQEGTGEPGKDLSLIAEAVTKKTMGKNLTRREGEALANSHFGEYLLRQLDTGAIMRSGRIAQWVKEIGSERVGGGLYSDVAEVVRSTLRGEGLKNTQGRVSLGGERVTFTRLERSTDGRIAALITKADGSTRQVPVSEIDFGDNTLLEDTVKEMAALRNGPAMLACYDPGQDLGGFIDAWQIAEIYGSRSGATLDTAWADAGRAIQQDIRYEQFRQAFEMGRREREQRIAEREKKDTSSAADAAPSPQGEGKRAAEGVGPYEGSRREGKVSFDGAEIEGVKYDAVDKSRLTSRQKRQIAALEELAKVTGVNIVFYQTRADSKGRFLGANGAFFNNTIYLDVNAGMRDSRDNLRVAIIRTAAHELTHYIKENNAEGYETLQSFLLDRLIEWKGRSLAELAQDKLTRDTSGKLSMEGAIDEVVADGCEMMLRRSSVAAQLARENRSLAERIRDWVQDFAQKIRDAFEGVEAYHDEAKALEKHAAELQQRWDAALLGAIQNDQSGQATKNTARTSGEVQYQARDEYDPETATIKKQIENSKHLLNEMEPAADKTVPYFGKGQKDAAARWAIAELQRKGYHVDKQGYGIIYFDKNDIDAAARYADTPAEKGALALIYDVLKRGKEIGRHEDHDKRGKKTITFGAPVVLNGIRGNMAVVVNMRSNHFYAERIVLPDGSAFILPEKKNAPQELPRGVVQKDSLAKATSGGSNNSIREESEKSNTKLQERDFMPDDRELLLEAAEGGQGGADLQEYSKKAQKLEEHRRRLQRLQEAAESAEGLERDKITEKLRKTERSILNAEAALRKMESRPQIKRALEKATAAWRDANPNEAARTLRRLREQNRTQQELIEYWQAQARRTEPGKETLRQDDIRRVARALLKEHQSEADVDELSRQLQELGDYMTANAAGAGTAYYDEVKRRAGRAARLIVSNVYQTEDSHAQLRQELRDYLRNTPIAITDYIRQDMPELDYFRKKNMGTLRLNRVGRSLDEVYQSLGDQFGERWFPRDVTAPSDQLNQIVDALQSLEPSYYEMYRDYEVREISEMVAGEIIDTLLSGDVRQSETVADRAYRRQQEMIERRNEQLSFEKNYRRELVRSKVEELRENSIRRTEEYKARIRISKSVNRLARDLTENSKTRHVPEKFKAALGQLLLSIDTISPKEGFAQRHSEKTQQMYLRQMQDIRRAVASNLAFMNGSESDWKGMLLDLPQDLAEVMEQHIDSVQAAIDGDKTWVTARMNQQQLQELEEILTVLSKAITQQNELLAGERGATVSGTAEETVKYLDALERAKGDRGLSRFLQWDNTTPYYFFKRFGPAGLQIFRELQNGWGKMAFNSREIIEFANRTYTAKEAKEAEKKLFSFQLHKRLLEKTEDGNEALRSEEKETVRMTKAQVMELYALSKREQALGHILGAGIRISDIRDGLNTITQADNYLLTLEELNEITGVLSKRDRAIVDALQAFMNSRGTDWGNEVSMARFGIRQFTEKNYWPISTDPRGRTLRDPGRDNTNLFRLLNMGFTKNTIRDASNSLVLGSAFDTFANHMADMAKYNALGLPLLDAMKWYSYNSISDQSESGQYTTVSMQKSAEGALGAGATKYFITFMKDMNGTQEGGRGEEFASKMLSNYKVASVAANLRVAVLQPTAYVRAAAVLDPKYLAKGVTMGNKQGREKAMKYSGTAVWKDLGFYDTNINTGLREMIKHADNWTDEVREKSMFLAEWGDKTTWGYLWNACEAEVAERQHLRGEELMKATAQRFDDVIYQTQVMDSTMTRSQSMRQKGVFAGMATSFMSEPTLSYNMVLDAYNEFRTEKRRSGSGQQAWRKTRGKLARAMLAYAATAAAAAVVESAADAWRDDDEYASFTEKWLEKMGFTGKFKDLWEGNLWSDLAIHNKLPYLRDFDSMLHGFETNRLDMEWMKSLKKAYEIISETVKLQTGAIDAPTDATYNGRMTTWGKIYNVMKAVSQLTGLPLASAGREITAIWNNTVGRFGGYRFKTYDPGPEKSIRYALQDGYLTEEEAQRLLIEEHVAENETDARQTVYEWGLGGAGKYDEIYAAVKADDRKAFETTLAQLQELGYSEKNILSAVKTQIREWYQGTEKNPRSIEKAQASKLLQKYAGMRSREADELVQEWACFVVTGMQYGDMKEAYLNGELSSSQVMDRMKTFGGKDQDEARAAALKWQCEKDTGIPYSDVREAYVYKEISETQARSMLKKYGQMDEKGINQTIAVCDFAGTDDSMSGITGASALYYFESVMGTGIDKKAWLRYWDDTKEISGDDKQKQIIAYIDSLNLTPQQKDVIFRFHYRNSEKTLKKTPWHR